jgi:hypothetical protein
MVPKVNDKTELGFEKNYKEDRNGDLQVHFTGTIFTF